MSSEGRRRSSRISELEERNAHVRSYNENMMTLDTEDEESDHKGRRKRVKTRPLQDLISDPVERQTHMVGPQAKKLLSDAFESSEHRTNATTLMDPRTPLPNQSALELLHIMLQRRDSQKIFAKPVDPAEVEGYQDVIEDPMDFSTIGLKLRRGEYNALEDFEDDVFLVFDNAMKFNLSSTFFYRQARAVGDTAEKLFQALRADPTKFETYFSPASLRGDRWTKAEGRLLNSICLMISNGTTGKRNEDPAYQCRQTYQPPAMSASDVPENLKTLIQVQEKFDYKGSLMRYIKDLGPMAKFVAMRKLSENLPQGSIPKSEVPHLQTEPVTFGVPNISQGSFHHVGVARPVHQGPVHQNAIPALTEKSYRNATRLPHLNLNPRSSNFNGRNVPSIGGMYGSENPKVIDPEASHRLGYPTHQTGHRMPYMNMGLGIGNDSERNMSLGELYSSSFYKPAATTPYGNPNPFAALNIPSDYHGSSFSDKMQDPMKTEGPAKMGRGVSSYPGMQAIAAKGHSPLLSSWQEPSQGASSFPGNDYQDLGWKMEAVPILEGRSLDNGQRSNWLSSTNESSSIGAVQLPHWLSQTNKGSSGQLPQWLSSIKESSSIGAGQLPHCLSPVKEGSSTDAGAVPNWLSLSHGGGSDQVSICANQVTSEPQFFEFLCPRESGPSEVDVMGQARIPNPEDQALLQDAHLRNVFNVQDARTPDPKGKAVMEDDVGAHRPSSSSNFPGWFLG